MEVDIEDDMGISPVHFLAGALAGTAEHCGMYPVDTIKVRFNLGVQKKPARTF
jgi:hypothetical protein